MKKKIKKIDYRPHISGNITGSISCKYTFKWHYIFSYKPQRFFSNFRACGLFANRSSMWRCDDLLQRITKIDRSNRHESKTLQTLSFGQ